MKTWLVVLTIAVIGLGAYSIDLHGDKEDLQRTVLAQYTDKLTDASEKLSHLQRSVSQSLLFQDEQAIHSELDSVWRLSSEVRSSIANIPIGQELSNEWMNYLGRLGDEAKRTAKTGDMKLGVKKCHRSLQIYKLFLMIGQLQPLIFINIMEKWMFGCSKSIIKIQTRTLIK